MKDHVTKFSGIKQEYSSGATRDTSSGKGRFDLIPTGPLQRVAQVYERGAKNHGERNWEKGFNMSRAIDSALRHILQYKDGKRDEDHLGQAVWNILAAMHFEMQIEKGNLPKELNDLPTYYGDEEEIKTEEKEIEKQEVICNKFFVDNIVNANPKYDGGSYARENPWRVLNVIRVKDGFNYLVKSVNYGSEAYFSENMLEHFE